jgi:hypothetical protein
MIDKIEHVFEISDGVVTDMVLAESREAALEKFKMLTTLQGKNINVKNLKSEHLYLVEPKKYRKTIH